MVGNLWLTIYLMITDVGDFGYGATPWILGFLLTADFMLETGLPGACCN
jgi:hypothetical protein